MHPGCDDDQALIVKLAAIPSFDVYTMRMSLPALGIEVKDEDLELTEDMRKELGQYSRDFTLPLVATIFGDDSGTDSDDLVRMFRDPDLKRVHARLRLMSKKTGIPVEGLPEFLQEYQQVYLSTSYFKHSFNSVLPEIIRCVGWLNELKSHHEVSASPLTQGSCERVLDAIQILTASVSLRLEKFKDEFELFWKNMSADSFRRLTKAIEDNHAATGASLCGLMVKIRNWSKEFPDNDRGGSARRITYVMQEMEPGLERLIRSEKEELVRTEQDIDLYFALNETERRIVRTAARMGETPASREVFKQFFPMLSEERLSRLRREILRSWGKS